MRALDPIVWFFSVGDVLIVAGIFLAWPILTLCGWLARRRAGKTAS